jgi:hypothetical protein
VMVARSVGEVELVVRVIEKWRESDTRERETECVWDYNLGTDSLLFSYSTNNVTNSMVTYSSPELSYC